jgi:hypothetical protein
MTLDNSILEAEAIAKVIATARREIGVREIDHSNTGTRVQEYQAATTLGGTGWPWCVAFLAWVIKTALGDDIAKEVWLPSASCDLILDWATRKGIIRTVPTEGCIGLEMVSRHNAVHGFLVTDVSTNDESFETIEGNSNDDGAREGNGVYPHTRTFANNYLFVYWMNLIPTKNNYTLYAADGHEMGALRISDGIPYVAAWQWASWINQTLGWSPERQSVYLDGIRVTSQIKKFDGGNNRAFIPITSAVATVDGLSVTIDKENLTVRLINTINKQGEN